MACYAGETKTTPPLAEDWHDLETPWDSVAGRSPLCQLVRMANDRRAAMQVVTLTFPVVGADPDDEFLGLRDYTSDPARNPAGEFEEVLITLQNVVAGMVSSSGQVDDGIRWHWVNADTVRADLTADLDGLVTTLQQDWQPIIEALRKALDALSGADIESDAWTPTTVRFALVPTFGSGNLSRTPYEQKDQVALAQSLTPGTWGSADELGGDPDAWYVDQSEDLQAYGDRALTGCAGHVEEGWENAHIGVLWNWGQGTIDDPDLVIGEGPTFCTAEFVAEPGWYHRLSETQVWGIAMIEPNSQKKAAVQGKSLNWQATVEERPAFGSDDNNPVNATGTATPDAGSILLPGPSHPDFEVDTAVEIDVELNMPAAPADATRTKGLLQVKFVLVNPEFDFCIDANGQYRDPEE